MSRIYISKSGRCPQTGSDWKQCPVCKEIKPLSDFHRCKGNKDGRQYYCKVCSLEYCQTRHRGMKRCEQCGKMKLPRAFYEARTPDGKFHLCKDCCHVSKIRTKDQQYRHYASILDTELR